MPKYLDLNGLNYFWGKITAKFVAKETGKGLSTNDFTTAEKNKLAGIEAGAEVNVQSDWNASSGDAAILNKPTIPTKTSDLQNDSGFLTSAPVSSVNGRTGAVTVNEVPSVSASDNGKVLKVVNGEWAKSSESGLTSDIKDALLAIFEKVAFIDNTGQSLYDDLFEALYPVTSISAVFDQGQNVIYDTDSLDDLKQYLTVTATYEDSSTATVTDYTLSGTLTAGTSTITVTYSGKTTTFSVTVTATPSGRLYHLENRTMTNDDTIVIPVDEVNVMNPDQDFTIGCDVTITSKSGDWKIMRHYETTSPWRGLLIGVGSGYFRTKYFNDGVVNMSSSPASVTRARVVMTHTAGSNKMTTYYRINDAGTTSSGTATQTFASLTMGNMALGKHSTNTWSGIIAKFDIYNYAFTQAEAESYITGE